MMIRIIKHIPLFFLFLAAFIFNAHMIIPHDHHAADADICHDYSYPSKAHHSGFPVHCHAFNDLSPEKITLIILSRIQRADFESFHIFDEEISNLHLSWIRIFDLIKQPVNSANRELSSLRAPPSIY
ncbi:MAG TPA: hypothetical protein VF346_02280 [Bacteroidales bacterium]